MKIRFLGHSSFVLETANKKILLDPFDEQVGYPVFKEPVDIATVSHDHWDHSATDILAKDTEIIRTIGTHRLEGITITGYHTFHDRAQGRERGDNIVFKIETEDLKIVHLGDLGHKLSPALIAEIGPIDVLLIPVGGVYTINADEAVQLVRELDPAICIPMHFSTPYLSFELEILEKFTQQFDAVLYKGDLEIVAGKLPTVMQVIVLEYPTP